MPANRLASKRTPERAGCRIWGVCGIGSVGSAGSKESSRIRGVGVSLSVEDAHLCRRIA